MWELGKLDSAAVSQIAAEKLALELTMAEQLFGVARNPAHKDGVRDAHWTVQKLHWLKRKLSGEKSLPALEQSTPFGTYCAALAERLSAIAAVSSAVRSSSSSSSTPVVSSSSGAAGTADCEPCLESVLRTLLKLLFIYLSVRLETKSCRISCRKLMVKYDRT